MKLFVFGLGYSSLATAARMRPMLERLAGTTRTPDRAKALKTAGIDAMDFDGAGPNGAVSAGLGDITHILQSIAPPEAGDPVLAFHGLDIARTKPAAICYLSTVGVYGDHDGGWVDEESPCHPASGRSQQRLAAEAAWRAFCNSHGIALSILRLAGIYGPGRGPFQKLRAGTSRRIIKPGQVFNRIHVDDIAQIVSAALSRNADGIFNCADDEPAPPQDVIAHACEILGMAQPPEEPIEEADLSAMARSFYGENKRVKNDKIKAELGIELAYPTFREGFAAIAKREGTTP